MKQNASQGRFSPDTKSQEEELTGSEPRQFNISQHRLTSSREPSLCHWVGPCQASARPQRDRGAAQVQYTGIWSGTGGKTNREGEQSRGCPERRRGASVLCFNKRRAIRR